MQRSRRRRRPNGVLQDIPLTPLIDTALTLLIIFMVATPVMHNAIRVSLPQGQVQEGTNTEQDLVIYLDKHGGLFFNGVAHTRETVVEALKTSVGTRQNKTVFVKADQAVSYGDVVTMIDKIKIIGGVQSVTLATQKQA